MKVVLTFEARELCAERPSQPDEDEFDMYLNALYEELSCIQGVSKVMRKVSIFQVETNNSTLPEVKELLRPALTSSVMSNLRLVSLLES